MTSRKKNRFLKLNFYNVQREIIKIKQYSKGFQHISQNQYKHIYVKVSISHVSVQVYVKFDGTSRVSQDQIFRQYRVTGQN